MAVSIIACQTAVIDPEDTLGVQLLEQTGLNILLGEGLVAMRRQQAARRGEDGATSVALDRAALEHEVETIDILALDGAFLVKMAVDGVILFGRELIAPAIEAEIDQTAMATVVYQRDESMIARPGVVGGNV